jgi:hypothetical protein
VSDVAADPPPEPTEPQPEVEPAWKSDEYLTSGRRFLRWNLISLVLGLLALCAGVLWLQAKG